MKASNSEKYADAVWLHSTSYIIQNTEYTLKYPLQLQCCFLMETLRCGSFGNETKLIIALDRQVEPVSCQYEA